MSNSKTIVLKGDPIKKENIAAGVITPGDLIKLDSNNEVARHASAGGITQKAFAVENSQVGRDKTQDYAIDDSVQYVVGRQGDELQCRIAAGAAAIVIGDALESAGDGTLRKFTSGAILGWALEALDLSAATDPGYLAFEVA